MSLTSAKPEVKIEDKTEDSTMIGYTIKGDPESRYAREQSETGYIQSDIPLLLAYGFLKLRKEPSNDKPIETSFFSKFKSVDKKYDFVNTTKNEILQFLRWATLKASYRHGIPPLLVKWLCNERAKYKTQIANIGNANPLKVSTYLKNKLSEIETILSVGNIDRTLVNSSCTNPDLLSKLSLGDKRPVWDESAPKPPPKPSFLQKLCGCKECKDCKEAEKEKIEKQITKPQSNIHYHIYNFSDEEEFKSNIDMSSLEKSLTINNYTIEQRPIKESFKTPFYLYLYENLLSYWNIDKQKFRNLRNLTNISFDEDVLQQYVSYFDNLIHFFDYLKTPFSLDDLQIFLNKFNFFDFKLGENVIRTSMTHEQRENFIFDIDELIKDIEATEPRNIMLQLISIGEQLSSGTITLSPLEIEKIKKYINIIREKFNIGSDDKINENFTYLFELLTRIKSNSITLSETGKQKILDLIQEMRKKFGLTKDPAITIGGGDISSDDSIEHNSDISIEDNSDNSIEDNSSDHMEDLSLKIGGGDSADEMDDDNKLYSEKDYFSFHPNKEGIKALVKLINPSINEKFIFIGNLDSFDSFKNIINILKLKNIINSNGIVQDNYNIIFLKCDSLDFIFPLLSFYLFNSGKNKVHILRPNNNIGHKHIDMLLKLLPSVIEIKNPYDEEKYIYVSNNGYIVNYVEPNNCATAKFEKIRNLTNFQSFIIDKSRFINKNFNGIDMSSSSECNIGPRLINEAVENGCQLTITSIDKPNFSTGILIKDKKLSTDIKFLIDSCGSDPISEDDIYNCSEFIADVYIDKNNKIKINNENNPLALPVLQVSSGFGILKFDNILLCESNEKYVCTLGIDMEDIKIMQSDIDDIDNMLYQLEIIHQQKLKIKRKQIKNKKYIPVVGINKKDITEMSSDISEINKQLSQITSSKINFTKKGRRDRKNTTYKNRR